MSRIAQGTRVTGEVAGATELSVEGEVEGTVRVESRVSVAPGGVVRGEIHARSVLVAGEVHGDVHGAERVEVGSSGTLEGDIAAPRVTIAEGAFFKGKVEMTGQDTGRRGDRPAAGAGGGGGASSAGQSAPKASDHRRTDRPGTEGAAE